LWFSSRVGRRFALLVLWGRVFYDPSRLQNRRNFLKENRPSGHYLFDRSLHGTLCSTLIWKGQRNDSGRSAKKPKEGNGVWLASAFESIRNAMLWNEPFFSPPGEWIEKADHGSKSLKRKAHKTDGQVEVGHPTKSPIPVWVGVSVCGGIPRFVDPRRFYVFVFERPRAEVHFQGSCVGLSDPGLCRPLGCRNGHG